VNLKKLFFCKLLHWHSYATYYNYATGKKWRQCIDCGKQLD